jgi:hypothetical protein
MTVGPWPNRNVITLSRGSDLTRNLPSDLNPGEVRNLPSDPSDLNPGEVRNLPSDLSDLNPGEVRTVRSEAPRTSANLNPGRVCEAAANLSEARQQTSTRVGSEAGSGLRLVVEG